jgi:hypothetical protein
MTDENQGEAPAVTEDVSAAQPAEDQTTAQDQGQDLADDAGAATDEQPQQRPKQTVQDRIDELTAKRREAEREAEYWRSRATQPPREAQPEPKPQGDGRPDPAQYGAGEFDPQYLEDLTDWKAANAVRRELDQRERQSKEQAGVDTFKSRLREQYPDGPTEGQQRIFNAPQLSPVVQDVLVDSDIGPKIADHLGSNPRELARISALPPIQQARELVKLEMKLAAPPVPVPKTVSDAPAVTPTVRGQGGRFAPAPDTDDFSAFEKTYGG